ncbi:bifunctional phosphoribosylaminoimidazolecarboxamide formyltransferase/IMP cyclohydrolase [Thermosynechococcaceae cyanobacterium BACA0444]|uniref:Bifunctional purine biosynthesis protein PurH n=1 Tax=Pseudocalidococcus azoricus BACA0444 TaxID=2918990 RepID=A0AAE4JW34_9CYAN|nr:bifunctional phosphoribosylaminoimidazolecarboxamide formyltransferase/IMP cyclohydrolase [Pseudocalidococcus azoricus]MDS3860636.1 bifunctional phosphoribosylaminoimidazolecarboxamide formyltransferase/IMP cyclohydrolase [Pseudocalidococcus azoricus BACA0444]
MTRLALLSTSDKSGLVDLAQTLVAEFGFQLLSSGGTAATLAAANIPVTKVSDYTQSPEILGGRVKTLHPKIHGGILARRDLEADLADLAAQAMEPIDLVVVNLYPFQATIAKADVSFGDAIENIDIGGPTLIRAAAKNHAHVTVLSNPSQYAAYLQQLRSAGARPTPEFRLQCAQAAFAHTAEYDQAIANYLLTAADSNPDQPLPATFTLSGVIQQTLRYGENPHQAAAWYRTGTTPTGWAAADLLQGKELSYNNLLDLEAARSLVAEFSDQPTAVIVKHTNPCGVATASTLKSAYERAFAADSVSAFGGIVALNRPLDAETSELLTQTFLECVVVPGCEPAAVAQLAHKPKVRVLVAPDLTVGPPLPIRTIAGGFLAQAASEQAPSPDQWEIVTQSQPTPEQWQDLIFAWKVVKHVKSNAIVVAKELQTLGIGAGQMNRVGSVQIALADAAAAAQGAVLASDGFFPFADSVQTAAAAGVKAIVQPGGSLRDQESIQAANELGLVMVFTNRRYFRH